MSAASRPGSTGSPPGWPSTLAGASWYQGVTHYTHTRHAYRPGLMVLSRRWFDSQPEELKRVLLVRTDERRGVMGVRSLTGPLLENLKAAGLTVCQPPTRQETLASQARVRPVWDAFARESGSNARLLEAVLRAKKTFAMQPR